MLTLINKHDIKVVEESLQRIIDAGTLSGGSVEQILFCIKAFYG